MVSFLMVPALLYGALYIVAVFFCVWKFYQMLSKINDNLAGIERAISDARAAPKD